MVALISGLSLILCFASQSRRKAYVAKCIPESSTPETRYRVNAGTVHVDYSSLTRQSWKCCLWIVKSFAWQFNYADNYRAGEGGSKVMVEISLKELIQGILPNSAVLENGRVGREPAINLERSTSASLPNFRK